MAVKFVLCEGGVENYTAGVKAPEDVVRIAVKCGYTPVRVNGCVPPRNSGLVAKVWCRMQWAIERHLARRRFRRGDVVFLPASAGFLCRRSGFEFVKKLKRKGVKFVFVIHDIHALRMPPGSARDRELALFSRTIALFDLLIVHNDSMKKWLVPIAFGLAVTAEPLIAITIGEKWLPCVPLLSVLCFGSIFNPLTFINLNLLYVKGRTDYVLKLELMKKPIAFAIVLSTIPLGIFWMCVGKAVYDVIAFCFNCHYTKKLLSYGLWQQTKEILPIIINGLIMIAVVHFAMLPFACSWIKLVVGILIGAVSYLGVAVVTRDSSLCYVLEQWKRRIH